MRACFNWVPLAALALLLLKPSHGFSEGTVDNLPSAILSSASSRDQDSPHLAAGRTLSMSPSAITASLGDAVVETRSVDFTRLVDAKVEDQEELNRVDGVSFSDGVRDDREYFDDAVEESVRKSRAISTRVPVGQSAQVIDGNEVGSGYQHIQPTRSSSGSSLRQGGGSPAVSMTEKWVWNQGGSGEGDRAPRGRQLRPSGPRGRQHPPNHPNQGADRNSSEVTPSASRLVQPTVATFGDERKTNPDIQDIITGIVNLLHGKTPPTGSTANIGHGRPLRPINTRINNRGPPRISDIPPSSVDGDLPPPTQIDNIGMLPPPPPRNPPPYPFETPLPENSHQNPAFASPAVIPLPPQPTGSKPFPGAIPLPEQVVPVTSRPHGRPHANVTRPGVVVMETRPIPLDRPNNKDKRPGYQDKIQGNQDKRPGFLDKRPSVQESRPASHDPRPRPRPQPPKRRPLPSLVNKKPSSDDVVLGNKKEDQYVTVDEEAGDDGDMGISLTVSSEDVNEDITFTTDHPVAAPVPAFVAPRPGNATRTTTTTTTTTTTSTVKASASAPKIVASSTSSASSVGEATTSTTEAAVVVAKEDVVVGVKTGDVVVGPGHGVVGLGEAHPVIESSMGTASSDMPVTATKVLPVQSDGRPQYSTGGYRPRPGIVLDDTEYKPMSRPVITAPPRGQIGEVFDVTVSAIQGPSSGTGKPYVYPVEIDGVKLPGGGQGEVSVITAAEEGQHFVSIDGKRTYINLFGDNTEASGPVQPTVTRGHIQPTTLGTGSATPELDSPLPPAPPKPHRPHTRRPGGGAGGAPPVRIDTCIVGDDNTCDVQQNERCVTETGVSSCHCRQGYARRKHREPCRRIVSIAMSLRVDKLYDRRITWSQSLQARDSEEYRQLQYEASRALDSAMSMTPFSDEFMGAKVLNVYQGAGPPHDDANPAPGGAAGGLGGAVFVNLTLQLEENAETSRPAVKHDIQRHLLGVIHRRNNNVGDSALWVDSPPGSVSQLQDIDECTSAELNDCHADASCSNVFGSFRCSCTEGTRDPWAGNVHRQGRQCETCAADHCHQRGMCRFDGAGKQACACSSGFYGAQCEIDGEVLGVAIGASVAAVIIIALTLVCLCMWSRRWSREQKTAAGLGSPVFGYMAGNTVKTPHMGGPPYQVSMEDRLRWAQIADVMAQANHYAQPEPVQGGGGGPTRPSSAVFGYPTLSHGHLSHMGTMPGMHNHTGTMPGMHGHTGTMPGMHGHTGTMPSMHGHMVGHQGTMTHSLHGTMQHGKMPLPPVPLPRHSLPHNAHSLNRSQPAMSIHGGGYSLHGGGTYNPHAGMRTPDTKKAFDSSSSDEEDRADLLGRNFHVPRPKSRSSVANQSGIYYDVDTDQADLYSKPPLQPSIPMSLYGMRANNQYFMQ